MLSYVAAREFSEKGSCRSNLQRGCKKALFRYKEDICPARASTAGDEREEADEQNFCGRLELGDYGPAPENLL